MSVIVFPKRDPLGGMSREELIKKIQLLIQNKTIKAYLFGSVARNTQNAYSDVDLILIADMKIPFLNRPESFPELLSLPVELNLFVYNEEEWEKIREQSQYTGFWKSVFSEMIQIF
ncbi:nucleotidyltransferase domain-containing protein [Leptospira noguchii]|uniref:nucleotidyltransferase domain-containing protein n=1 Tax=Leptospira noguchii TaxID=28182 RepID=UPI0002488E25|nr:nucleotidyltransferase domain-containing protein [Leptospira noguchii]EKR75505.1 putative toxin-antitoxin system, toxin component [Leptospira noguchii str. 2006001870]EMS82844.1 putative toxin-antitoxin system, toxin component [Leptospira noguchii str. Hook]EMS83147.1 putative toxin-antitoxin system, toxin component [Leptospira noguchii str. Cascata]UOG33961.1 nucleotidyltransferase domain-containing protein [Leptospira noguchii]UOG41271.1 nucleotidyltransferase domain-containing protein [L